MLEQPGYDSEVVPGAATYLVLEPKAWLDCLLWNHCPLSETETVSKIEPGTQLVHVGWRSHQMKFCVSHGIVELVLC